LRVIVRSGQFSGAVPVWVALMDGLSDNTTNGIASEDKIRMVFSKHIRPRGDRATVLRFYFLVII
jgi:hypothetical protein